MRLLINPLTMHEEKDSRTKKRILVIAIFIIILITFLVGEVTVRIFDPQILYNKYDKAHPSHPYEERPDKYLGWVNVPKYTAEVASKQNGRIHVVKETHNSQGFRMDHEVNYSKKLIFLSGDSFIYGWGIDDAKTIGVQLNKLVGSEYDVINLGVSGYGTDQSYLRYIKEASVYPNSIVIYAFYANDLTDNLAGEQTNVFKPVFSFADEKELKLLNEPVPDHPYLAKKYGKKEHTYTGLDRIVRSWSELYVLLINHIHLDKKEDTKTEALDGVILGVIKNFSEREKHMYRKTLAIISVWKEKTKTDKNEFILVAMPSKLAVDVRKQRQTEEYYKMQGNFEYDKPYAILEEYAKKTNTRYINLYPVVKKEVQENNKELYLNDDDHFNDAGAEVAAREIYKYLKENRLIDNGQ
ncbi:SGNH/GDSL hydrolase family protein [Candidatus Woesearchaeota archaeon]|nr:SGNH/GDSL hydrolase family protein [Candidatus Woesearchaeota archaeon]